MWRSRTFAGLVVVAGVLALAPTTRAGDTFRLDMPGPTATTSLDLKADEDADLFATRYHGGGFHGGFYGGHRGFHHGFHHRAFYGGYRSFYGYGSFYRPVYRAGYRSVYYGGYAPAYGYGVSYGYGYYPCSYSLGLPVVTSISTLRINPAPPLNDSAPFDDSAIAPATPLPGGVEVLPSKPSTPPSATLPAPRLEGTYPYDGGPKSPIPMPRIDSEPMMRPSLEIRPATERLVSLELPAAERSAPAKGKWAYPAYGEAPQRTSFAADRDPIVKPKPSKPSR